MLRPLLSPSVPLASSQTTINPPLASAAISGRI
jgi:hypothetical protein